MLSKRNVFESSILNQFTDNFFNTWEDTLRDMGISTFKQLDNVDFSQEIDIYDNGKVKVVECNLPGFKKEDIKVDILGGILTISGSTKDEVVEKDEKRNYSLKERRCGSFFKCINLVDSGPIKEEEIEVFYEDGVLKVVAPLKFVVQEEVVPKKLTIK